MSRKKRKLEAHHYEQAIDVVESFYPVDIFGRGSEPLPKDLPEDVLAIIQSRAARMARLTCRNILQQAQLLAEND